MLGWWPCCEELERDLIVERLAHGLEKAKEKTVSLTQCGAKKVNGAKSILERRSLNAKTVKALKAAIKKKEAGKISRRGLCDTFKNLLKLKRLAVMTSLRMMSEIRVKFGKK